MFFFFGICFVALCKRGLAGAGQNTGRREIKKEIETMSEEQTRVHLSNKIARCKRDLAGAGHAKCIGEIKKEIEVMSEEQTEEHLSKQIAQCKGALGGITPGMMYEAPASGGQCYPQYRQVKTLRLQTPDSRHS